MTEVAIDFATYGTKPSGDRSGAYLFLPDGPAEVSAFWSVAGQCTQSRMKWVKFALNWMETYYHVWKGGIYISKLCEAPSPNLINFVVSAYRKKCFLFECQSTKVLIRDTIFTSPTGDGAAILRGHPSHATVLLFAG